MTTRLILMLNRNAWNSTRHFDVNSYFNVGLSNVCIVLTTLYCLCVNDNTSLAINIRCNAISIDIINFDLARIAHFPMLLVSNLRSKVSCTLKVMQSRFIKSTCSRNASLLACYFNGLEDMHILSFLSIVLLYL